VIAAYFACLACNLFQTRRHGAPVPWEHLTGGMNLLRMSALTHELAVRHDHWTEEPTIKHLLPTLRIACRHFVRRHFTVADAVVWTNVAMYACMFFLAEVIANP
jgi:hypothetical protein